MAAGLLHPVAFFRPVQLSCALVPISKRKIVMGLRRFVTAFYNAIETRNERTGELYTKIHILPVNVAAGDPHC